ncbi:hypothetical protein IWX92DRAFT_365419 [Phyllosticta citricarpa]
MRLPAHVARRCLYPCGGSRFCRGPIESLAFGPSSEPLAAHSLQPWSRPLPGGRSVVWTQVYASRPSKQAARLLGSSASVFAILEETHALSSYRSSVEAARHLLASSRRVVVLEEALRTRPENEGRVSSWCLQRALAASRRRLCFLRSHGGKKTRASKKFDERMLLLVTGRAGRCSCDGRRVVWSTSNMVDG